MPFPMKIQPIDSLTSRETRNDIAAAKPVLKSRLKRLFDRPLNSVLRISSATEKPAGGKDVVEYFEPSSVCLDKMVQNFIEENNETTAPAAAAAAKCGRNRCNCFNGNSNDSSDDEFDFFDSSPSSNHSSLTDSSDTLKGLIPCASTAERNLLADTSKIVEKNKACKRKDDLRKIVTDGLLALGYNSSICKSKWEKSSSIPAGEYEYIEVNVEGERILIDVDFRSEFEIARSTGAYKAILQSLPFIFVGKADRLLQIILIVSEAARLSLKKKGMHVAPWRKSDYMKAKWLSPFTRVTPPPQNDVVKNGSSAESCVIDEMKAGSDAVVNEIKAESGVVDEIKAENCVVKKEEEEEEEEEEEGVAEEELVESDDGGSSELDLIFGDKVMSLEMDSDAPPGEASGEEEKPATPVEMTWQPPTARRNKVIVTGLASLLKEKS